MPDSWCSAERELERLPYSSASSSIEITTTSLTATPSMTIRGTIMHDLQAQVGVPEERRYVHSWKYLTLISLCKLLLNHDQSQPWNNESQDSTAALEDFIVDSYGSRDPDLSRLFTPDKELKLKGTLKVPFINLAGERIRIKDLPTHIQEVNRAMEQHVIRSLHPCLLYTSPSPRD